MEVNAEYLSTLSLAFPDLSVMGLWDCRSPPMKDIWGGPQGVVTPAAAPPPGLNVSSHLITHTMCVWGGAKIYTHTNTNARLTIGMG